MRRTLDFARLSLLPASLLVLAHCNSPSFAADEPTVEYALSITPVQREIDYDRPTAEEAKKCVLEAEAQAGVRAQVVRNENGQIIRRFQDTNGDDKVDTWCYFKNGVEVYRDVDGDSNGRADQYRWLGTAGTRWGLDSNEDGRIDEWKVISAEEVTAEVVAALRENDVQRFTRLLIEKEELQSSGLATQRLAEIEQALAHAAEDFDELVRKQKAVQAKSNWVFFGGGRPGVIPAGSDGSTKDIYLYDNVSALIETDGQHAQIPIGALLKVGDTWRLVDVPANLADAEAPEGHFFQASLASRPPQAEDSPDLDEGVQKLIADLDLVDQQLSTADQEAAAKLNAQRADLLEKLVAAAKTPDEKSIWIRQFADTVSAAVQTGTYPQGLERLETLLKTLTEQNAHKDLVGYARYRLLFADYGLKIQNPMADFAKIQEEWQQSLDNFIKDHGELPEAAEAMLQIAIASEYAGKESDAMQWYTRITKDFDPALPVAAKAAGAKRRLESVGKTLELQGKTADGKAWKLSSHRGRPAVIYYWASWCDPCKEDFPIIKKIQDKFKNGVTVIGINLDTEDASFKSSASSMRSWLHVREAGGLDGPLANELGVLTVPTMLLLDKNGKVVNRNVHSNELEKELEKLIRR